MSNVIKSLKNICLYTVFNFLLIFFIVILSFYLIGHINRINSKKNLEKFRTTRIGRHCNPVIQNKINMNQLARPLDRISKSLQNIDAKLDFVNGFKTIKEGKRKSDKTSEVPRLYYPDNKNEYKFSKN